MSYLWLLHNLLGEARRLVRHLQSILDTNKIVPINLENSQSFY